jgi:hypothetical protein
VGLIVQTPGTFFAHLPCKVASPNLATKEEAMNAITNSVTYRIACCRRQRAKARTDIESEAWRAEEEGLRDAVLHQDHVHKYRGRSHILFERYMLGFQDGKALMRIARISRFAQATMEEERSYI